MDLEQALRLIGETNWDRGLHQWETAQAIEVVIGDYARLRERVARLERMLRERLP